MATWQEAQGTLCYKHYFSALRPEAPKDICTSITLSEQSNAENSGLDIDFVESILSSTGPVLVGPVAWACWQWDQWPPHIQRKAESEYNYYAWLEWVLFWPAAHAVCAVRDHLYSAADMVIPQTLRGLSDTKSIGKTQPRGTTDILHFMEEDGERDSPFTAHEVKRANVLAADGSDALEHLVHLATDAGGWAFRDAQRDNSLEDKARRLLSQALHRRTHPVRNYPYNSCNAGAARDMAELVLFYTHALLTKREPYPQFHSASFHEALLCNGPLMHRAQLVALRRVPDKRLFRPLSVQLLASYGSCRHDGDIVISFGRLVFWLLETRIVAKAAYQSLASDRLLHEFAVYDLLRGLQGVVIPSLFGLYRNLDDGSSILVTSYAGLTLEDFDALSLPDRKILLLRVARLHQMGVLHNDLEPRNVVFSKRSGPRIIDFDNATLGHTCTGLSCKELYELARRLRLDLGAELSRPELSRPARSWFLVTSVYVFMFFILSMAMYSVRYTT
ncbi:RIO-like kinase [Mycena sanguinolenta]|uniref:RIO-like kinase n=1 Tax=Mycena sanguinolenta TaxID=230812 RepID=A0A8H7CBB6_9AGAR|nr:RIO-like kinase [Mycena sanguinolenta]